MHHMLVKLVLLNYWGKEDSGFKIRDQDLKNRASKMQNQPKTRLRESSQTLPRFQDRVRIFRDPHFQGTILYT